MAKRNRFQKQSTGNKVVVTSNDLYAIDIRPYPFMPLTYLCALKGLKYNHYKDRFTILRHDLGLVDCPAKSFQVANAFYRPFTYALTPKGFKAVSKKYGKKERYHALSNLWHDMIPTLIVASMEIGAKEEQLAFVKWGWEINGKVPDYRVPTEFTNKKGETVMLEPDWSPVGIGEPMPLFFLIEADHNTETMRSNKTANVSLERKYRAYLKYYQEGQHKRLRMPMSFVIWAFVNRERMQDAMNLLLEIKPGGVANFLFINLPDFTTWEKYPPPTGWALRTSYQRAGHPPFNILGELNGRAEARANSGTEKAA